MTSSKDISNTHCPHGHLNDDVARLGKKGCTPCYDEAMTILAKSTVVGHLLRMLWDIFNFEFISAFGDLYLAYMRLTRSGCYDPEVKDETNFYASGHLERPEKKKK